MTEKWCNYSQVLYPMNYTNPLAVVCCGCSASMDENHDRPFVQEPLVR